MNRKMLTTLFTVTVAGGVAYGIYRFLSKRPTALPDTPGGKLVEAARGRLGTLYQWGGGHSPDTWGLDCSGLVLVAAKEAGIPIKVSMPTADGFWKELTHIDTPEIGSLAFYGTKGGKAYHVAIVTNVDPLFTIAANGGDSSTTSQARAMEQKARVTEIEGHPRKDLLGYATLTPKANA